MSATELDEGSPLWLINEQIKGLLEGDGAGEDHEAVLAFLRSTGLPEDTVARMHKALVHGDSKIKIEKDLVALAIFNNDALKRIVIKSDPEPIVEALAKAEFHMYEDHWVSHHAACGLKKDTPYRHYRKMCYWHTHEVKVIL